MYDIIIFYLEIFVLLLCSSFLSGAETGITAASQAKLLHFKLQGNKRAEQVLKLRENKESFISALLFANNGFNILSSAIATNTMVHLFGDEGVIYATFIMTILILIFAEALPKSYAFENPEKVSMMVIPAINFLVMILKPLNYIVQKLVSFVLKLFHVTSNSDALSSSGLDAIRGAIELSHHEGKVFKKDKDMLGGVLDLSTMTIEQVMIHRSNIVSIDINLPVQEIIDKIIKISHTKIPLWDKNPDNIIGILNSKDLITLLNDKKPIDITKIKSILKNPWFVPETTVLKTQLELFKKKRNHIALAIDEYGELMGLITLNDIMEEIVGRIEEEDDNNIQEIKKISHNQFIVNGEMTIRDLNRELDLDIKEEEDYYTIAGLIIFESNNIPAEGDEFVKNGLHFVVLQKKHHKIEKIAITLPESQDD